MNRMSISSIVLPFDIPVLTTEERARGAYHFDVERGHFESGYYGPGDCECARSRVHYGCARDQVQGEYGRNNVGHEYTTRNEIQDDDAQSDQVDDDHSNEKTEYEYTSNYHTQNSHPRNRADYDNHTNDKIDCGCADVHRIEYSPGDSSSRDHHHHHPSAAAACSPTCQYRCTNREPAWRYETHRKHKDTENPYIPACSSPDQIQIMLAEARFNLDMMQENSMYWRVKCWKDAEIPGVVPPMGGGAAAAAAARDRNVVEMEDAFGMLVERAGIVNAGIERILEEAERACFGIVEEQLN